MKAVQASLQINEVATFSPKKAASVEEVSSDTRSLNHLPSRSTLQAATMSGQLISEMISALYFRLPSSGPCEDVSGAQYAG